MKISKEECMRLEKRLREFILDKHKQISNAEKPSAYRIGGTYYGATEMLASVGNMLDFIEGDYETYGYHSKTRYKNCYLLRIGGAYKLPYCEIWNDLQKVVKETLHMQDTDSDVIYVPVGNDTGFSVIGKYGTNFAVYGFGYLK